MIKAGVELHLAIGSLTGAVTHLTSGILDALVNGFQESPTNGTPLRNARIDAFSIVILTGVETLVDFAAGQIAQWLGSGSEASIDFDATVQALAIAVFGCASRSANAVNGGNQSVISHL